jgi:hypothetical protein
MTNCQATTHVTVINTTVASVADMGVKKHSSANKYHRNIGVA